MGGSPGIGAGRARRSGGEGGSDEDRRLAAGRRGGRLATGGAGDDLRQLGMYSFRIKRIHPQTPEERFWGDCGISPQTPLKRPKAGGCGPPLWNPTPGGVDEGAIAMDGGIAVGEAFGRTVGGGLCPALGRGVLRGTGFRASASLRTGHGMGIPSTNGPKLLYSLLLFPRRSLRWCWRGGCGGWCFYPLIPCHCEERSDAAIRSF